MRTLKNIAWAAVLLAVFSACSSQPPQPEAIVKKVPTLKASGLYNAEQVYAYKEANLQFHEEMALSYLEKAKETEASNLQKAVYYTKRAITLMPTLELYQHLAGLLQKTEQQEELLNLYRLIAEEHEVKTLNGKTVEYLFGKPDEDLFYNYLAAAYQVDTYWAGELISKARRLGIPEEELKEKLLADQRLKINPKSREFLGFLVYVMTEEEVDAYRKSSENFRQYLASIKDSAAVFEISPKAVSQFNYDSFYSMDNDYYSIEQFFVYYLKEKQDNPDGWFTYELKRKIKISDQTVAVLYAVDSSAAGCPIDMRHVYHRLVTYSKAGDIIQSMVVASQSGNVMSTVSFAQNKFVISEFKRTWKKPYNKDDFDNFLVKTEKTGERSYEIRPDGSIVSYTAPASVTAPDTLLAQATETIN